MTGVVLSAPAWQRARAKRAAAGKAPRLSLIRLIILHEDAAGRWTAAIRARRFGVWAKAERLCGPTSYDDALAAALRGWRQYRLPVARSSSADRRLRPFYVDNPVTIVRGWA